MGLPGHQTGLTSPTNALLSINGRIIAGTDAGGIKYSTNNETPGSRRQLEALKFIL
jgi:hypothetical protein